MLTVVGCRILVRPIDLTEHDEAYASAKRMGLTILDHAKRKEEINVDTGHVLQIGEECHKDYIGTLKVGDKIGFAKFGGKFFPDPDNKEKNLIVINDEDVIVIF